jgi:tRNA(Ile)-lysidine synthase
VTAHRSHPPALRRIVERAVRDDKLFSRGDVVLVACSGGPDSMALLHVLAMLRKTLGHVVVGHGVDHGLRAEAASELALADSLCERLDVPFDVTSVSVASEANLQARAREARHRALQDAACRLGATVVATGHTADDKAETVLLRLLRGAGPRGLAVLPSRSPPPFPPSDGGAGRDLVRPMIRARRADVLSHLSRHDVAFSKDPSNLDPKFTRVRVRNEVLPLLSDLSPRITEHLCALADMLGELEFGDDPLADLGRAQRELALRGLRGGERIVKIRVKGGRELAVTFPDGNIVLNEKK